MSKIEKPQQERNTDLYAVDGNVWVPQGATHNKFTEYLYRAGHKKHEYRQSGEPEPTPTPYQEAMAQWNDVRLRGYSPFNGKYTITRSGTFKFAPAQVTAFEGVPELDRNGNVKKVWDATHSNYVPVIKGPAEDDDDRYVVTRHEEVNQNWTFAVLDDRIFL